MAKLPILYSKSIKENVNLGKDYVITFSLIPNKGCEADDRTFYLAQTTPFVIVVLIDLSS